jgi:hypothetical protein
MTVLTRPIVLLRLEGLTLFLTCLVLYALHDGSWLLFVLLALAPDLAMLGYRAGPRIGAACYNLAHTYPLPAALAAVGWQTNSDLSIALALIWLAHIGVDRAVGYGLKYPTGFKDTHLGGGTRYASRPLRYRFRVGQRLEAVVFVA